MATCGRSLGLALLSTCTSVGFQHPGVSVVAQASPSQCMHNSILSTVQVIFLQYTLPGLTGFPVQASMTPPLPFGCYMLQNQYRVNGPKFRCPSKCSLAPSDHSCSDLCVSSRLSLEKLSPGWPSPSSMP